MKDLRDGCLKLVHKSITPLVCSWLLWCPFWHWLLWSSIHSSNSKLRKIVCCPNWNPLGSHSSWLNPLLPWTPFLPLSLSFSFYRDLGSVVRYSKSLFWCPFKSYSFPLSICLHFDRSQYCLSLHLVLFLSIDTLHFSRDLRSQYCLCWHSLLSFLWCPLWNSFLSRFAGICHLSRFAVVCSIPGIALDACHFALFALFLSISFCLSLSLPFRLPSRSTPLYES